MSIRFSIPTVAITALLVLSHSAIASAEAYKTSNGQVVVTGLTAKQKYPIKGVNAKDKPANRQDVIANTCGEALVDGAAKYKSLVVGTETIDPATLTTKVHVRCSPKKTAADPSKKTATEPKKKGAKAATMTKKATPATGASSTGAPATGVPSTSPSSVPSVTPVGK
jgi:hypothetical protein